MEFSRQEYWNGVPDPGIRPESQALPAASLLSEPLENPHWGPYTNIIEMNYYFLQRAFIVTALTFRSLIHFDSEWIIWGEIGIQLYFFACEYHHFSIICWKQILYQLNGPGTLVKNQFITNVWIIDNNLGQLIVGLNSSVSFHSKYPFIT